jgi:hypothetical protein
MMLIRAERRPAKETLPIVAASSGSAALQHKAPTLEQTVRAWHEAGTSQRAIARELCIDRRKVKRIIQQAPRAIVQASRAASTSGADTSVWPPSLKIH